MKLIGNRASQSDGGISSGSLCIKIVIVRTNSLFPPCRHFSIQLVMSHLPIRHDTVSAISFCTVKGRIGHLDKLDRIRRVLRRRGDTDAYGYVMGLFGALADDAKWIILD